MPMYLSDIIKPFNIPKEDIEDKELSINLHTLYYKDEELIDFSGYLYVDIPMGRIETYDNIFIEKDVDEIINCDNVTILKGAEVDLIQDCENVFSFGKIYKIINSKISLC